jgi:hypothetical protein
MTKPTPEYDIGDRVGIPHINTYGEVSERWWSDNNKSWIYRVYRSGDGGVKIYQEKNLNQ